MDPKNIILIGMPGAGKSTIGILLAKYMTYSFIDTDVLIQSEENRSLQRIIDTDGYMALRSIEERVLLGLAVDKHVIATGGSAVYSAGAMEHLRQNGTTVFLDIPFTIVLQRVTNFTTRGIACHPDQTIESVFHERYILYKKYADRTVNADQETHEEVVREIITKCDLFIANTK